LNLSYSDLHCKLTQNYVLRVVCGYRRSEVPSVSSFYDFVARVVDIDDSPKVRASHKKPKKKLKKGEKLPPKHPGVTERLANLALSGRRFEHRPELVAQQILATTVRQSITSGIICNSLTICGDGTCIKSGAATYGKKTCGCKANGIYNCECPRKFSDPNASWGWDSHNECYYYGYTGYFLSTYNKELKLDLPLYLRIVSAKRHDSISGIVAIAEFRDIYPDIRMNTFVSDSASDNYATYKLLGQWGINAVIALGKTSDGYNKFPSPGHYSENGIPVCPAGHKMVYWGSCRGRPRVKWRCPRAVGKAERSVACASCSPSPYGRVFYTKPEWDLRMFTSIPRGTPEWKSIMKERTCAERINNRILNDYGVGHAKTRGKKRITFFAMIAAINIHLDAQVAYMKSKGQRIMPPDFSFGSAA